VRSFGYDNAGNTTSDSSYTSTYDLSGRLTTLTKSGATSRYAYDAMGKRVRKHTSTAVTTTVIFVYDQAGQLLGEYDRTGAALREYVWLGSTPIALFTPDPANAANPPLTYFIHADHLDTPRVVVDKANAIRWRWLAEPFGTTAPETNPQSLGNFTQNLRFPGQYAASESGLSFNFFRDYDSSIGRYVQSHPIGLDGGVNTYSYVGGDPMSYTDPLGLNPGMALGAGIGTFLGGPVGTLVGGAVGFGVGAAVGWYITGPMLAKPFTNDPQAQAEYEEYKRHYAEPPPPFKDPCDELRWRLKREEDLLRWDAKWLPGRHAGMNGEMQSQNAIRNLKEEMKKKGCDCP